jgi:hypothetical protein
MARIGMTYRRDARIVDEGQEFDCVVYAVSAEQWRARRVDAPAT